MVKMIFHEDDLYKRCPFMQNLRMALGGNGAAADRPCIGTAAILDSNLMAVVKRRTAHGQHFFVYITVRILNCMEIHIPKPVQHIE